jgi:hypothetical protein
MPMSPRLLRPLQAGGFDPRRISSLLGWFDATDTSTTTLDGSNVSEWRDKSGVGSQKFTQGTGASQPILSSTGLNGRRALEFTGARWMTLGSQTIGGNDLFAEAGNAFSVYVVMQTDDGTVSSTTLRTVFAKCGGTANQRTLQLGFAMSALDSRATLRGASSIGVDIAATTSALLAVRASGTSAQRRFNSSTATFTAGAAAIESQNITIGARTESAVGQGMFGFIGEVIVYGKYLSDAEEAALFRYVNVKWGLTVA